MALEKILTSTGRRLGNANVLACSPGFSSAHQKYIREGCPSSGQRLTRPVLSTSDECNSKAVRAEPAQPTGDMNGRASSHSSAMALPVRGDSVDCTEITTEGSAETDFSSPTKGSAVQRETPLRYSRAYERALMRRVDRRLLPILGALYAISLVDRVNVCC
jgi:hypothetical protein